MRRNGMLLALFAMLTTAVVAGTQLGTAERIAKQQELARTAAMREILVEVPYDNALLDDGLPVRNGELLGYRQPRQAFRARLGTEVTAVLLPVIAPDGYTGAIQLLVGVLPDGRICGVRTLQHRETPGLGDKVELRKSPWILDFGGHSLENPGSAGWAVRKDGGVFDQFTGATITPRAVVAAIARALRFVEQNHKHLFALTPPEATR